MKLRTDGALRDYCELLAHDVVSLFLKKFADKMTEGMRA